VLLSGSATGEDAWEAHHILLDTNNNNIYGYQASEIGNSTMRIWMSAYGVQEHKGAAWSGDPSSNGASSHDWGSGNAAYVRVIATVGGGGGAGPRAYVAFDGRHPSDLTGSITSSSNVSSIEDKGVGQYEVNLASSISNPLLVSSPIGHHRQNYNDIVWHETHAIALPYGPNGNGITGGLGATTTSKIWVECNQPQTGGSQDAPVHLLVF
jgi:hypothetical protein